MFPSFLEFTKTFVRGSLGFFNIKGGTQTVDPIFTKTADVTFKCIYDLRTTIAVKSDITTHNPKNELKPYKEMKDPVTGKFIQKYNPCNTAACQERDHCIVSIRLRFFRLYTIFITRF